MKLVSLLKVLPDTLNITVVHDNQKTSSLVEGLIQIDKLHNRKVTDVTFLYNEREDTIVSYVKVNKESDGVSKQVSLKDFLSVVPNYIYVSIESRLTIARGISNEDVDLEQEVVSVLPKYITYLFSANVDKESTPVMLDIELSNSTNSIHT